MLKHIKAVHDNYLYYKIQYLADGAADVIRAIQPYHSLRIVQGITEINRLIPKMDMGPDNPNTGQSHHVFEIGRELGLVIYVKFLKTYMPRDYDYAGLRNEMEKIGRQMWARPGNEFEFIETPTSVKVRFWWG